MPTYLGIDPLGNALYTVNSSGAGGNQRRSAIRRPPDGVGIKTIGGDYLDYVGWDVQFGNAGGDDAGHWLVQYDQSAYAPLSCGTGCGFDFGNGIETGSRILRYDASGNYLGSIPSPGTWRLDPAGKLHVIKDFTGTTDLGCGTLTGGSGASFALASLDLDGMCIANKAFSAPKPKAVTLAGDGSILLGIQHTGSIDLGSGPLPDLGGQNLTIAKLDLDGNVLATRTIGGTGSTFTNITLDAAPSGIIILSAKFGGTVDLGAGPIGNAGDTLLAAFDPDGTLRWSKVVNVGSTVYNFAGPSLTIAWQPCSMLVATNSPTVDLGAGPVTPVPSQFNSADIAVLGLAL
ncbi:Hypothetical protein A7982_11924 [Minicystis rosea]|nr:Hypothetical protein A7982_11924 [Minicystis rosea]